MKPFPWSAMAVRTRKSELFFLSRIGTFLRQSTSFWKKSYFLREGRHLRAVRTENLDIIPTSSMAVFMAARRLMGFLAVKCADSPSCGGYASVLEAFGRSFVVGRLPPRELGVGFLSFFYFLSFFFDFFIVSIFSFFARDLWESCLYPEFTPVDDPT